MLHPKKKISKKEIKQDTLLTTYAQATTYYYENKKYINYAMTAVIVIVIGIIIYTNNRNANNVKAATELGKVFGLYDAAANNPSQFKLAIDGQPERGIMGLKALVDNYGGTESGQLARFYLATAYLNLGRYDEALRNFEDFSGGGTLLKAVALAGIARCYEAKGEPAKSAPYFEKAAGVSAKDLAVPDYLNSAARCYGLAGDRDKALNLYKRIKKEFPASTFAREADRYISQFSA